MPRFFRFCRDGPATKCGTTSWSKKRALSRGLFFLGIVGMARFELATSWSQTRRDNRATLHPERKTVSKI